MTDRRTFLLPLVVVAVAGALWWFTRSDDSAAAAPEAPRAPEVEAPADQGAGRSPAEPAPEVRVQQPLSAPAEDDDPPSYKKALSGLRGRLVWQGSKEPVPGVEVQCIEAWLDTIVPSLEDLLGMTEERLPILFKGKGRSGSDGRFEIQGVHGTAFLLLGIGLRTDKAELRFVDRMPAKGETVDLGDVELGLRGSVEGRVVDAEGKGIAGARVRVADLPNVVLQMGLSSYTPEGMLLFDAGVGQTVVPFPAWVRRYDKDLPFGDALTDGEGKFLVTGCRVGQSTAIVSSSGLEGATRAFRVREGKTYDAGTIVLKPGLTLRGRFVDREDKPVSGLRVAAGTMLNMAPVALLGAPREVDAEGRFALSGLTRGKIMLAFQRAAGEPWEIRGPYRGDEDLKLTLPKLVAGSIQVQDQKAQPVDGAQITLLASDEVTLLAGFERRLLAESHLRKDAEKKGLWHVEGVPAAEYKVVARAPGFGIDQALLDLRETSADTSASLTLPPAVKQRFEAVDEAGKPVAAARIYWYAQAGRGSSDQKQRDRRSTLSMLPVRLGKTDAQGGLESSMIEAGATRFVCRHPGFAMAASGEQKAGTGAPIRFALREGGHIEGVLRERGAPPSELRTIMIEPSWELGREFDDMIVPRFTVTRPDGSFTFRHLDPGKWRLETAPAVGQARSVTEMIKLAEESRGTRARAEAQVTAKATTRVQLEAGAPATGDGCTLVGSVRVNGRPATGARVQSWGPWVMAEVDENGAFVLRGLNPGDQHVRVERVDSDGILRQQLWQGQVKIEKGKEATLHLALVCADVKLQLDDPSGQPLPGVMMQITGRRVNNASGVARFQAMTGENGLAELAGVPEGTYDVGIEGGRDRSWAVAGTTIEVNAASSGRVWRVRAIPPVELSGRLRFDLEGLEPEERELASKNIPEWTMLESPGGGPNNLWTQLTGGEAKEFHFKGLAPGRYTVVAWGQVRWAGPTVEVTASGASGVEVALKPDREQLKRQLEAAKKKTK